MHCPFCQHEDTRVIDSRLAEDGATVRRRRECPKCAERFNTFETAELKLPSIVKSGERREPFDEHKLRVSFERALQKRPVPTDSVDTAVREIVNALRRSGNDCDSLVRHGVVSSQECARLVDAKALLDSSGGGGHE